MTMPCIVEQVGNDKFFRWKSLQDLVCTEYSSEGVGQMKHGDALTSVLDSCMKCTTFH